MDDFADVLKQKAAALSAEQAVIKQRLAADNARLLAIHQALDGIDALMKIEGIDPQGTAAVPVVTTLNGRLGQPEVQLYGVLKEALADGRPRTVKELITVAKARGVDFGEKEPYRTVSFTLMGISRGKQIERVDGETWRAAR